MTTTGTADNPRTTICPAFAGHIPLNPTEHSFSHFDTARLLPRRDKSPFLRVFVYRQFYIAH